MTTVPLSRIFQGVRDSLIEFGYPSVTTDQIKKAHADWKAGKEPEGIIAMFATRQFDEYRDLIPEDERKPL